MRKLNLNAKRTILGLTMAIGMATTSYSDGITSSIDNTINVKARIMKGLSVVANIKEIDLGGLFVSDTDKNISLTGNTHSYFRIDGEEGQGVTVEVVPSSGSGLTLELKKGSEVGFTTTVGLSSSENISSTVTDNILTFTIPKKESYKYNDVYVQPVSATQKGGATAGDYNGTYTVKIRYSN